MYINKFFKHLHRINKHKYIVFKLAIKAGIPFRGLVHDLSKYSPTEFFEGVKYYNEGKSPISKCKKENGYSKAWLHHKGRNKHHFEYWYDFACENKQIIMPYEYTVEMICDTLAASLVYNGNKWNKNIPLEYFNKRKDLEYINPKIRDILVEVYILVSENGIAKTVNKKTLNKIYYKHINNKEEDYKRKEKNNG